MRRTNISVCLFTILALTGSTAHADRHFRPWHHGFHSHFFHPSFGFYLGFPWYPRTYYSYPYDPYYPYYPPRVVTVPVEPPVYIEREPSVSQELPSGYWYYCSESQGYYPYVKECPSGWQQVSPIPPK